jgi:hypothetical protein
MGNKRQKFEFKTLTKRQRMIVLPIMVIVGVGLLYLVIVGIIKSPIFTTPDQRGVAANGFTAYPEEGTDLGVGKAVSRDSVVAALGNKAKSVSDPSVSKVFNFDGDRSQTVTFNFVRADGKKASLYIDMTQFKSSQSMDGQHILAGTALAQIIQGHSAYYMHAQTLSGLREYRIAVINDLTAYKFVIDQPESNITIKEISAVAALINLAQKAQL